MREEDYYDDKYNFTILSLVNLKELSSFLQSMVTAVHSDAILHLVMYLTIVMVQQVK